MTTQTTQLPTFRVTITITTAERPDWIADSLARNIFPETESYELAIEKVHQPTEP